ncbi:response regulator [Aquimarina litoralis]|uniref:response regulator n=1 Tax=Aquimarina litoralis TaxID=584605 RepID=UPI001C5624CE|nr:response regulator [Aquimarina litoralis]MBW1293926.1 response regulator [Aquimarina litoralis]
MKKINCILLVDDSKSTNFYNKKLIQTTSIAHKVFEVYNGLEALDYLNREGKFKGDKDEFPRPNVIFLDINMPKMDGFEFLEEYIKLPLETKSDILIAFLTTSNWEKDRIKAYKKGAEIYDFIEKPLEKNTLSRIYNHYMNTPNLMENMVCIRQN